MAATPWMEAGEGGIHVWDGGWMLETEGNKKKRKKKKVKFSFVQMGVLVKS